MKEKLKDFWMAVFQGSCLSSMLAHTLAEGTAVHSIINVRASLSLHDFILGVNGDHMHNGCHDSRMGLIVWLRKLWTNAPKSLMVFAL